jgi:hypothetical protein
MAIKSSNFKHENNGSGLSYRVGRNLALYKARGAQQDCFFVVFPSEIRQMPETKLHYRASNWR